MDWGSVFASGLLGTAKAAESIADDQIKLNQADQAMLRRIQLEDQLAQAKSQRETAAMDAAYQRGDQAGQDRRFNKFLQDVGPGADVDKAQLRQVFTDYYDNIEGRYTDPESAKARDVLNAARTSGVSTQGLTSLRDEYKSALTTEQQARVAAAKEEKERLDREQRDRVNDDRNDRMLMSLQAMSDRQDKSLAAMASRQSSRGADGKPPENERISVLKDVYGKMLANMPQPKDFKDAMGEVDQSAYEKAVKTWEQTTAGKTATQTLQRIYQATGLDIDATAAAIADVKPPEKAAPAKAAASASSKPEAKVSKAGEPVRVSTPQEVARLPRGTVFIAPDGIKRVKN